jgi:Copper type II ascorbate-dependent monooxygenase, C-terminal domain
MHKTGVFGYNKQIRNGTVIRTGKVDFFEFAQQGSQSVQQPEFVILPGDAFDTHCYFDNPEETTTWGLSSQEEMCMV